MTSTTMTVRPAAERGRASFGWLDTRYSFSFADYFDPEHMGFRDLRVINEDRIAPAKGFGDHPHRDMEILTYVLAGEVEHRDNAGSGGIVRAGDIQRMTAGTGIVHSERNPSATEELHLLQIWILPERTNLDPGYEQRSVSADAKRDGLCLVASRDGRDGSVVVHQDVDLYATILASDERREHVLRPSRHAWVQVVRGGVRVNDVALAAGDGLAVSDTERLAFEAGDESELLLFDLS